MSTSRATPDLAYNSQSQASSSLLNLPIDVRDRIYDYVLGGQVIHIYSGLEGNNHHPVASLYAKTRLCTHPRLEEFKATEDGLAFVRNKPRDIQHGRCMLMEWFDSPQGQEVKCTIWLELLLTCRQIYMEACLHPFPKNTFFPSGAHSFHAFLGISCWCPGRQQLYPFQREAIRSVILEVSSLSRKLQPFALNGLGRLWLWSCPMPNKNPTPLNVEKQKDHILQFIRCMQIKAPYITDLTVGLEFQNMSWLESWDRVASTLESCIESECKDILIEGATENKEPEFD